MVRGGSWYNLARNCRPAYRCGYAPEYRNDYLGFRVAAVQESGAAWGGVPAPAPTAPPSQEPQPQRPQPQPRRDWTNSIGMKLARIEPGSFVMGSTDWAGYEDEHPQHEVRITQPFYLGVTEVTQAQYEAVMDSNPSWFESTGHGKDKVAGQSTSQHPVENVSWLDAVKFCNKLSEMEGRKPFYEINEGTVRVPDWKALRILSADGGRVGIRVRGRSRGPQRARLVRGQFGEGCPTLWGRSLRTGSAFMTCSATSGSGAGTLTTRITTSHRRLMTRRVRPRPRPRCIRGGCWNLNPPQPPGVPWQGHARLPERLPGLPRGRSPGMSRERSHRAAGWSGVVAEPTPDRAGGRWRSKRGEPANQVVLLSGRVSPKAADSSRSVTGVNSRASQKETIGVSFFC